VNTTFNLFLNPTFEPRSILAGCVEGDSGEELRKAS